MKKIVIKFLPWSVLLLLWVFLTETDFIDPLFLSSPSDTFISLLNGMWGDGLFKALCFTIFRALTGFVIASIIGIPLGLLIGGLSKVNEILGNVIDALRSMPATAMFPAFLLIFGIGDSAKIAVVTFVCLWTITIYTSYGIKISSSTRRFLLKIHNVGKWRYFIDGYLFPALPNILGGMRTAISLSLVITVGVEMIVGTKFGLGQTIYIAQTTYNIPLMYASIILSAIGGVLSNKLFLYLSGLVVRWETNN